MRLPVPKRAKATGIAWTLFGGVAALLSLVLLQVLRKPDVPVDVLQENHAAVPLVAAAVLLIIFVVSTCTRNVDVKIWQGFPWLIGGTSFIVAVVPWVLVSLGRADLAMSIYRGLQLPQGVVTFWDLSATLEQIECPERGFNINVIDAANDCADGFMYGPGLLWFRFLPTQLSEHIAIIGLFFMLVSSLMLVWLARLTPGVGQLVLFIAAIGAPWQLLLERGNIESLVLWVVCASLIIVRRWNRLATWVIVASLIWVVGTWKWYPFALGVMLVPVLRLRRGWIVISGYVVAFLVFMVVQWEWFEFSSAQNVKITFLGDWVSLGREPVVSRMIGGEVGSGLHMSDFMIFAVGLVSVAWGVAVGICSKRRPVHPAMLAAAGSSVFLAVVLIGGFGWAHKATFLLLSVPLVAEVIRSRRPVLVASASAALMLIAVSSFVVVNTMLATLAGLVAAGFSFGLASVFLARYTASRPSHEALTGSNKAHQVHS